MKIVAEEAEGAVDADQDQAATEGGEGDKPATPLGTWGFPSLALHENVKLH